MIEKILKQKIIKTYERINIETNEILNISNRILTNSNGYEFTENFDGKIIKNNNIYYFNLKFVCDNGGAQTRTLREVYHFIKYQINYLKTFKTTNIYFINILDGDTCYKNMNKFIYLLDKEKDKNINNYLFIGSLYEFQKYYYK